MPIHPPWLASSTSSKTFSSFQQFVEDPGVLACRARIAAGEVEERVAASIVFDGLVSRLASPQLGAAVLGGVATAC